MLRRGDLGEEKRERVADKRSISRKKKTRFRIEVMKAVTKSSCPGKKGDVGMAEAEYELGHADCCRCERGAVISELWGRPCLISFGKKNWRRGSALEGGNREGAR